jgi:hypothetical protein
LRRGELRGPPQHGIARLNDLQNHHAS